MTKEELAAQLDGSAHPLRVSREMAEAARGAGLVIVYGVSDDLLELRGAIEDEIGAYEGTEILITTDGLWDPHACESHCHFFQQAAQQALEHGQGIRALWDPGDGYSWRYETTIPHATFEIVEEGKPYCQGLIFALNEVGK